MSVLARWQSFWFPAVPVRRVAAFRIIVTAFCLYDAAASGYVRRYVTADEDVFYHPIFLVRLLHIPLPDANVMGVVQAVLIVSLVCALIGLGTRLALAIAAPLYLWWWATVYSFGAIGHGRSMVVIALILLAIAPSGRAYSVDALLARARRARAGEALPEPRDERDPLAGWALRVAMVMLVGAYLFAAYSKLRTSGIGWPTGGALDAELVQRDTALGGLIVDQLWLVHVLAATSLLWEATAWVLFLRGRIRDLWLAFGVSFHVGTLILLNIDFISWIFLYPAFYDLEVGAARLRGLAERAGRRLGPPLRVLYDGNCRLCVKTIAVLDGLDWFGRLRLVDGTASSQPELDAMYTIDDEARYRGYRAFRRIAHDLPALWPTLPLAYLPGVAGLGDRVYEHVAGNRGRNGSCAVEACSVGDEMPRSTASSAPAR